MSLTLTEEDSVSLELRHNMPVSKADPHTETKHPVKYRRPWRLREHYSAIHQPQHQSSHTLTH